MNTDLQEITNSIREMTFKAIHNAGGGHFGGCMSVIEILATLYFKILRIDPSNPSWEDRDRVVLSKGHGGPALYTTLAHRGFFPEEWLFTELDKAGGRLPKHVDRLKVPGIDVSSGALGQGLSIGCGMALAAKLNKKDTKVHVIMGEGECNSGQIWEAAMLAAKYKLDNLVGIVDLNNLQIDGDTDDIMPMDPFELKWQAFGWNVLSVDGHCIPALISAYEAAYSVKDKPTVIIASTTKGKGVHVMECRCEWHSGKLTDEQYSQAICDFDLLFKDKGREDKGKEDKRREDKESEEKEKEEKRGEAE